MPFLARPSAWLAWLICIQLAVLPNARNVMTAQPASPSKLMLVFPRSDQTYTSSLIRYAGSTAPGSRVTVNGKSTRVYKSGAFVGLVPLKVGKNEILFEATPPGKTKAIKIMIEKSAAHRCFIFPPW